jgi:hypothetical protein
MAGENKVDLAFTFTARVGQILADKLYSDKHDPFRELIQNAYGAGATRIEIVLADNMVTFKDNGKGMSYGFVLNEFGKIGMQTTENRMGYFGVGRLSVFKIGESVEVYTETAGGERTKVVWTDILKATAEQVEPTGSPGTEYRIWLLPGTFIGQFGLANYLENNVFLKNLTIVINGSHFPLTELGKNGAALEGRTKKLTTKDGKTGEYEYDMYPNNHFSYVHVLEKGLRVTEVQFPLGGHIDFHGSIKTASRNESVLDDTDIVEMMAFGYVEMFKGMKTKELERYSADLISVLAEYDIGDEAKNQLKEYLVINGKKLSKWEKISEAGKLIYYLNGGPDFWSQVAEDNGYTVLIVNDRRLADILDEDDIEELDSEFKGEMAKLVNKRRAASLQEREALFHISSYMKDLLASSTMARLEALYSHSGGGGTFVLRSPDNGYFVDRDRQSSERISMAELSKTGEGFKIAGIAFYFGKYLASTGNTCHTVAWHSVVDGERQIVLNVENPLTARILSLGAYDLLDNVIKHELAHDFAVDSWGHDENFWSAYNILEAAEVGRKLDLRETLSQSERKAALDPLSKELRPSVPSVDNRQRNR